MTIDEPTPENLSRGNGEALWKQIALALENDIRCGTFAEGGQRLPTEQTLRTRFAVNRHTVRRAIQALAEKGLVRTEQGRGVFVNIEMVEYPLGRRVRFSESLTAQQKAPKGRILHIGRVPAPLDAREALELETSDNAWRVDRLGFSEDRPITLSSHYFSYHRFPKLADAFHENDSITKALKRSGVTDYERRETRIHARPATAEETRILELPRGRPVLVTEGINIDSNALPVEFSIARFAADRVQLVT